jgi:hypothetical protein
MLLLFRTALASSLLLSSVTLPQAPLEPAAQPAAPQARPDNQFPECYAGPDITVACQGDTTVVTVDGSGSFDPDGDPLTFQWGACPGSFISDPTSAITQITFDTTESCSLTCGVRLRVDDPYGGYSACRLYIAIVPGNEGCTLGYWKNHAAAWDPTGFAPTDDFDTIFGFDAFSPDITLMKALNLGGGGKTKLARQGVAALLDAAHPDVEYPLSIGDVLNAVHDALASGQYEPLATTLDEYNNLGCPLDNGGVHHQGNGPHHTSGSSAPSGGHGAGFSADWGWAGSSWLAGCAH